jgi:hypothetical protein
MKRQIAVELDSAVSAAKLLSETISAANISRNKITVKA